jgi:hypothetical protein
MRSTKATGRRRREPAEPDHGGLAVIVIAKPPKRKRRRGKVEGKQPAHRNGRRARSGAARRDDSALGEQRERQPREAGGGVLAGGVSHRAHTDPRRQGHEAHRDYGGGLGSLSEIPQVGSFIPTATPAPMRNTLPPAPAPTTRENPEAGGLDALLLAKAMRGKNPPIGGFRGSGLSPDQQTAVTAAAENAIAGGVGAGGGAGSVYQRGGRTGGGRNSKRGTREAR